jgi:hypothetical protein
VPKRYKYRHPRHAPQRAASRDRSLRARAPSVRGGQRAPDSGLLGQRRVRVRGTQKKIVGGPKSEFGSRCRVVWSAANCPFGTPKRTRARLRRSQKLSASMSRRAESAITSASRAHRPLRSLTAAMARSSARLLAVSGARARWRCASAAALARRDRTRARSRCALARRSNLWAHVCETLWSSRSYAREFPSVVSAPRSRSALNTRDLCS